MWGGGGDREWQRRRGEGTAKEKILLNGSAQEKSAYFISRQQSRPTSAQTPSVCCVFKARRGRLASENTKMGLKTLYQPCNWTHQGRNWFAMPGNWWEFHYFWICKVAFGWKVQLCGLSTSRARCGRSRWLLYLTGTRPGVYVMETINSELFYRLHIYLRGPSTSTNGRAESCWLERHWQANPCTSDPHLQSFCTSRAAASLRSTGEVCVRAWAQSLVLEQLLLWPFPRR